MDLRWNPGRVSCPASTAVWVADWSWRGNLNPSPLIKGDEELLMDEYLSPSKLKVLTGVDDLQQVKILEMQVDTRENSLGNFGVYLPNLRELKLNNSLLVSVRDLGTTLSHLHILWMAHCGLSDLDGISSCSCLKEPDYNYRAEVKKFIPHLEYLDKIPASETVLLPSKKMHEDWLIIKESMKEGGLAGDISWLDPYLGAVARQSGCGPRPSTTSRPRTARWSADAGRSRNAYPLYGSCPILSDELFPDDSSDLTHGFSQVMCGNPTKALCARRQKLGAPAVSPLKLCSLKTENPYGSGGGGEDLHEEDVFSELRVQREQHKCCLETDQQEKATQALKVTLSDEKEGEDCSLTDSCEDELRETSDEDLIGRISVDSSCHSCLSESSSDHWIVSPGVLNKSVQILARNDADVILPDNRRRSSSQAQEGAVFSSLNHCLIPTPPKSPPPVTGVAARPWKTRKHRIRYLKIPNQEEDTQWTQQCQSRSHQETSAQPLGKELALLNQHGVPAASRSRGQCQPAGSTSQQRPISDPAALGSTSFRPIMDKSPSGEINHHQPAVNSSTRASKRFGLMNAAWPLTARATLQSLPDRPVVSITSQNKSPQS
ncbi:leucine rich repeat containing 56, transcript variant X3 [Columba livia]|uniref:Leucine rich repeat containing 56, transcript variant X3 n=1 Tax=Columba livia TaxID=8932 RepID=A0A2I0MHN9_COLLI|nr:leucine-rich repeat-containing protein 56 isoform X4 [Columba livia]PKK29196.1 leucine rich repeat containing 56, transcript variant X3 [Columba livia]